MNIRQLEYFVSVYESGSFLKAAKALFISQQALSRALASLEQSLDAPLFCRNHKGVVPTELGRELYRSCQPVLREIDRLDHHIERFIRHNYRQLKVGLAAGTLYFNAKTVWKDFCGGHPNLALEIEEYPYKNAMQLLEKQELDVLIFSDYKADDRYFQYKIKTWERVLLLPVDHPLCQKPFATPADLDGETFVLSVNDMAYRNFIQFCDMHNCHPADVTRVSDTVYMYETCNLEHCVGLTIEEYFTDFFLTQFPQLQTLRFKENIFPYTISVIARTDHPKIPVIRELAEYMKSYLERKK